MARFDVAGRRLGELELEVLHQLWAAGAAISGQEVAARLPGAPRAQTTVLTVLARLSAKGLVEVISDGQRNLYRPVGDLDQLTAQAIDRLLAAATDRSAVLAHLLHEHADPQLLEELTAILRRDQPAS